MILEEGMNVKVVMLPAGEDPGLLCTGTQFLRIPGIHSNQRKGLYLI